MRVLAIVLLALFAAPQFARSQAATPVLRYKAVIDNLRNADTSNAQLDRITTRLLPVAAPGVDTSGWTNAQKASAMLEFLRQNVRVQVQSNAASQEQTATAVRNAINSAAADLD